MRSGVSCSWCHRMNWTTDPAWPDCACGHRADRPRLACDCDRCLRPVSISGLREHVAKRIFAVDGDPDGTP